MSGIDNTVAAICASPTFDARIGEIRKIPGRHGTDDWTEIYARVARELYIPHLTPDFAYVHEMDFYSAEHFRRSYDAAVGLTDHFSYVDVPALQEALEEDSRTLLTFRVTLGLTREELAHATKLVSGGGGVSSSVIDGAERRGSELSTARALLLAQTIDQIMSAKLFGHGAGDTRSKQEIQSDTQGGWATVRAIARDGAPYWMLLHQRHYGGAFRQLLDATSSRRGDLIEDAVEAVFAENRVPYIRTGSHNQGDIMERFGLEVRPSPDFVVFDESSDTLMAMLECKGANDGGTARDKALRFAKLKAESLRLGGVPVMAVLGGIGWQRVNDTLGPVLADTDGRVFTMTTLYQILHMAPVRQLVGTATQEGA